MAVFRSQKCEGVTLLTRWTRRLARSAFVGFAAAATAVPAQAGVIPWTYNAIFGPVGSMQTGWYGPYPSGVGYSASYVPSYSTGYAPYTTSYAPYTTGYAPYTTGYAPATSYYAPGGACDACGVSACSNGCNTGYANSCDSCSPCGPGGCGVAGAGNSGTPCQVNSAPAGDPTPIPERNPVPARTQRTEPTNVPVRRDPPAAPPRDTTPIRELPPRDPMPPADPYEDTRDRTLPMDDFRPSRSTPTYSNEPSAPDFDPVEPRSTTPMPRPSTPARPDIPEDDGFLDPIRDTPRSPRTPLPSSLDEPAPAGTVPSDSAAPMPRPGVEPTNGEVDPFGTSPDDAFPPASNPARNSFRPDLGPEAPMEMPTTPDQPKPEDAKPADEKPADEEMAIPSREPSAMNLDHKITTSASHRFSRQATRGRFGTPAIVRTEIQTPAQWQAPDTVPVLAQQVR